jgi:hypothetical protein
MVSRDWPAQHIHECIVGWPCRFCGTRNLGLRAIGLGAAIGPDDRNRPTQGERKPILNRVTKTLAPRTGLTLPHYWQHTSSSPYKSTSLCRASHRAQTRKGNPPIALLGLEVVMSSQRLARGHHNMANARTVGQ